VTVQANEQIEKHCAQYQSIQVLFERVLLVPVCLAVSVAFFLVAVALFFLASGLLEFAAFLFVPVALGFGADFPASFFFLSVQSLQYQ
jgi:hypothetical protein